jgi:hypothetical protein
MSTDSIPPPFDLPALVTELGQLRDSAHVLSEQLTQLWIDSRETEDRIPADQLDPLVDDAMLHAALADAVHQRMTRQSMITNLGVRLDASRWARAQGLK